MKIIQISLLLRTFFETPLLNFWLLISINTIKSYKHFLDIWCEIILKVIRSNIMNLVLIKRRTRGQEHTVFIKSVQSGYISLTDMKKTPKLYLLNYFLHIWLRITVNNTVSLCFYFETKLWFTLSKQACVIKHSEKKKSNLKFHKLEDSFHLVDFWTSVR